MTVRKINIFANDDAYSQEIRELLQRKLQQRRVYGTREVCYRRGAHYKHRRGRCFPPYFYINTIRSRF